MILLFKNHTTSMENKSCKQGGNNYDQVRKNNAARKFYAECKRIGYKVLDEYESARKKVPLQCKRGHIWYTTPNNFMSIKRNCSRCSGKSQEISKEKWNALISGIRYVPLTEFLGAKKGVLVRCNVCEKEFWAHPHGLYSGRRGCPRCSQCDVETAAENFYMKLYKNNIKPLEEYTNKYKPVRVQHNTCGSVYSVEPRRYMYGEYYRSRCRQCAQYVNDLLIQYERCEISSFELLNTVKHNKWETRMEDLENELRKRDYRNAH